MTDRHLRAAAERWLADDPDPGTRDELARLLADDDEQALREAFAAPLAFGTAGIRGPLGPGPARMSSVVVRRCAAAVAGWLDELGVAGPVLVGRDARHGSERFARDIVGVVAGAGREVLAFPDPVPTPLLAYAVPRLGAAAGLMVTASHNPPADNGVKVYAGDGAQIVPPADERIARRMASVRRVVDLAFEPHRSATVPPVVRADYLREVAESRLVALRSAPRVVHTPLHGVGGDLLVAAFERAGLGRPLPVPRQAHPDPDFPTVPFPNPEEPGAMELVLATAAHHDADLALATDPDADRLAAAVPTADGWRVLTGDELGILLADHLLRHTEGPDRLVATTVVSSTMLARVAAAHGVHHVETLTGFKWLVRAALERPHLRPVLAYEEALGYRVGAVVRDKDGIGAAVTTAELVAALADAGSSVPARLAELAVAHGLHRTRQRSSRFAGAEAARQMAEAVDRLRTAPPASLGGVGIDEVEDLRPGGRLPPTDAVVLRGGPLRVVVRPSGTEPKLKAYVQLVRPVGAAAEVPAAEREADERIDAVLADLDRALRGRIGGWTAPRSPR